MAALCKALAKSVGIGLSITAVCKNVGEKTLGHDDFFVVKRRGCERAQGRGENLNGRIWAE